MSPAGDRIPTRAERWPLRRRVRLMFTAAAVVAAATMGVGFAAFQGVLDARQRVIDELDPAIVATDDYYSGLLAQQNAVRGVLLTDAPEFVEAYEAGGRDVEEALASLQELVGDRADLAPQIEAIASAARSWQEDFAAQELRAVEAGQEVPPSVVQASRAVFDGISDDVVELQASLRERGDRARSDLDEATRNLVISLMGAVAALLVVAATIRIALGRWVTDPLEQLGEEAEAVRRGELDRPIEVHGPPEIVAVASTVEAMRARIQADLREVEQAREELAQAAEELMRSNRDLEQFAYVASHDLQEPLRKVISFSQLLQQRYGGQMDERADQYIAFAVDGARRMQVLINDLLAFSRVGRLSAELVPVELDACAQRAIDNLSERIEETGATVEVGDLPEVEGELNLLTAVFQNLIGNAIKFRRPDVSPVVRVSASESPEHWEVTVADNGIGIEPEYADRVFVIFQRLHTKDAYSGTGIGLALCRRIIEHHGGNIWVDTTATEGTTIRFTIPKPNPDDADGEPSAGASSAADLGLPPAAVGSDLTTMLEGNER
ncbi:MAG: sensor histidine kinase [Actinomycetota bacterium]